MTSPDCRLPSEMTDRGATIVVGLSDALPDVLERLRGAAGGSAVLEIPDASSVLLTASEFRALKTTADRERVALTVATGDALRQQLAAMFELPVADAGEGTPAAPPAASGPAASGPDSTATEAEQGPAPQLGHTAPTSRPSPNIGGGEGRRSLDGDRDPAGPDKATATGGRAWPAWPVAANDGAAAEEAKPGAQPHRSDLLRRVRRVSRRTVLIAAAVLVLAIVLAAGATYLFFSRAAVAIALKRQPVSAQVVYTIAAFGASDRSGSTVMIAAQPVTFDVPAQMTAPATGTKAVGDATASGQVRLSNPTGKDVTIPAGTTFTDFDGVPFVFAAQAVVAAGKQAQATVRCGQPGTVGNRAVGALTGKLDSGVYVSNRDAPVQGGTDRQVQAVAQVDLDTLKTQADEQLLTTAKARTLPDGRKLLLSSVRPGAATDYVFDHRANDEAKSVSLNATLHVTALAYAPADVDTPVRAALRQQLAAGAPAGYALDEASLKVADPTAVAEQPDLARFQVKGDADVRAVMTDAERAALATALAGKSESEAAAYLRGLPTVDRFEITYSPSWLPGHIPSSAGRIDVAAT